MSGDHTAKTPITEALFVSDPFNQHASL